MAGSPRPEADMQTLSRRAPLLLLALVVAAGPAPAQDADGLPAADLLEDGLVLRADPGGNVFVFAHIRF